MVPDKRNDRENRPGRRAPAETANSSALTRVAGPRHTAQGGSDPESDLVRDSPGRDDPSLPPDCAGSSMSFIRPVVPLDWNDRRSDSGGGRLAGGMSRKRWRPSHRAGGASHPSAERRRMLGDEPITGRDRRPSRLPVGRRLRVRFDRRPAANNRATTDRPADADCCARDSPGIGRPQRLRQPLARVTDRRRDRRSALPRQRQSGRRRRAP